MKRIQTIALAFTLVMTIAMLSCNDPLQIGTELVTDGDVDFVNTDTFSIEALTTQLDSAIAYRSNNFVFTNQRLGWLTDPIFGNHRSDLFAQILPESFTRPQGQVDSVVLSVLLDTIPVYGNPDAVYNFEVFSVSSPINRLGTFYTSDDITVATSLGSIMGIQPADTDSIDIVDINNSGVLDTIQVPNRIRINLNNDFGNLLFGIDSASYTVADSFLNAFSGIFIKPSSADGAMLPVITTNSRVSVFYQNTDGEPRQYDYIVNGAVFSLHDHDYGLGTIDGSIDNEAASKDLLYLQGAGGPSISVKFPHIRSLSNVVVNEAILELTTKILPQDNRDQYPLPAQLYTSYKQDSILVLTPDISTAIQSFRDVELVGGQPVEVTSGGVTSIVYRFNLSDHIQSMIKGSVSDKIFIQLSQNSNGVERAVFNGINESERPIKLKITYTEI